MTKRITSLLLVFAALGFTGCKPDAAVKTGEVIDKGASSVRPGAPFAVPQTSSQIGQDGSISGVVDFKGTPPKRLQIDMSMDPACAMAKEPNMTEQYVVNGGKLANVYVYVKSGAAPSSAPGGAAPVVLDQKGCRYVPHVIAVQQGGSVQFDNSDPTMHNIHIVPSNSADPTVDISQGPMGAPQTRQFNAPETMTPVRCNNHPWMNAFLNVSATPFFAVSDAHGDFKISGLPPGTYTLAAVQEKLGEQDIEVTVKPHTNTKATFTFAK